MNVTLPVSSPGRASAHRPLRVGAISYLNTKPLIWGLDKIQGVELEMSVPSGLLDGFAAGRLDVGLLPAIDYQRRDDLVLVPSAGIGCEGPTMTVRIFSTCPIGRIGTLACDTDSHTSVALARIILAENFGIRPRFIDYCGAGLQPARDRTEREAGWKPAPLPGEKKGSDPFLADARLLIGDKVVCEEPVGYEHQLDLGSAWLEMTGLPFLFACWMARRGTDLGDLPQRLDEAKRQGLANVGQIISSYAVPRGWPAGIALQYLTISMRYDVGPRQLEAMRLFHQKACDHGLLDGTPRPLELYGARTAAL